MNYPSSFQKIRDDLIWAITSPPMMALTHNLTTIPAKRELQQWLQSDDHEDRLHQYLAARNPKRLGIYFEVLWQYFLEQYTTFELISRNLPVRNKGKTLGEFDFIYFCRQRQRYIHLETAVKFYLGMPGNTQTFSPWQQWVGPGCKDRLDIKLDRMLSKQTQLSQTPEGAALVDALGVDNLISEVCLKGYLFYPLGEHCAAPKDSTSSHLRGFWLKLNALDQLPAQSVWRIVNKQDWLSPTDNNIPHEILTRTALRQRLHEYFSTNRFPIMVAQIAPQHRHQLELARYFVTHNHWPHLPD